MVVALRVYFRGHAWIQGDQLGGFVVIQVKYENGLGQWGSCGDKEKQTYSRQNLKVAAAVADSFGYRV